MQNQGITIRKRTPDILMIVNFISPDDRYDDLYLSNYAMINVRDELLRVDGVSDAIIFGERDYSMLVWLDPQKMASYGLNAGDVASAIRRENLDVPAGRIGQPPVTAGQPFDVPIDALGRLVEPEQFADIIIKVDQGIPPTQPSTTAAATTSVGAGLPTPGLANPLQGNSFIGRLLSVPTSLGTPMSSSVVPPTATTSNTTMGSGATGGGSTGGAQRRAAAARRAAARQPAAAPIPTPPRSAPRRRPAAPAVRSPAKRSAPHRPARFPVCRSTPRRAETPPQPEQSPRRPLAALRRPAVSIVRVRDVGRVELGGRITARR